MVGSYSYKQSESISTIHEGESELMVWAAYCFFARVMHDDDDSDGSKGGWDASIDEVET